MKNDNLLLNLNEEEWIKIYKYVGSVVEYFIINEKEKQDLFHDTLLHVMKRLVTNYHENGKLEIWIKKVALNFCKDRVTDHTRKNTSYYEELIFKPVISHKYDTDGIKEKRALEILEESINELNHFDKQIITGRLNNESYIALAQKANKNKNTIIKHFKKTRTELQKTINRKYIERYGCKYKDSVD